VSPPVNNLVIELRCSKLHRHKSHVTLKFRKLHGSLVLVTAHVRGRHPTGVVGFLTGRERAAVAIAAGTHDAALGVTAGTRVTARCDGDANNEPSTTRASS
jgi:hypothetical protein